MSDDLVVALMGGGLIALAFWLLRQTPWRKRWHLDLDTDLGRQIVMIGVLAAIAGLIPASIAVLQGAPPREVGSALMGLWLLLYLTVLVIQHARGR